MWLLEMQIALAGDVSITEASHSDPPGLVAHHSGYLIGDFGPIRCGEHPSALALASNETETPLTARFQRLRDRALSLMVFDDSWILSRKGVQTTGRCIRTRNMVNAINKNRCDCWRVPMLTSTDSLMVEAGASQ